MEFEFWWLLALPLFFGLGWLAARVDIRHVMTESRSVPASYFRGLNYLLNEQPDRAIEAFIEVVRVDSDTVDLHFALGGLFRKRGEVERAIRMHQNLVEREDLTADQQLRARFELGQDYLKAGLLDRAEAIFSVLQQTDSSGQARQFLLEIYVQEKDWARAVSLARTLSQHASHSMQGEIGHYLCEMAQQAWMNDQIEVARQYLSDALTANRDCIRANVMLGDIAASRQEYDQAVTAWRRVETQSAAYLALVAERIMDAYRSLGRESEGLSFLRSALARLFSFEVFNTVFSASLRLQGPATAWELARDELQRTNSLRCLDRMLEAEQLLPVQRSGTELPLLRRSVVQYAQARESYQCTACGFRARSFFWHCPACGKWDSFPPNRKEE